MKETPPNPEERKNYPLTEAYLRAYLEDFPGMIQAAEEGSPELTRRHILSVIQRNVEIFQRDLSMDIQGRVKIMKEMLTYLEELNI